MNRIFLIIWREYYTRIRKRSFIVMTILGPLLFAALLAMPIILASLEDKGQQKIAVIEFDMNSKPAPDTLMFFRDIIKDTKNLKFEYLGGIEMSQINPILENTDYFGILVLHQNLITSQKGKIDFYCKKYPSMGVEMHLTQSVETFIHDQKLKFYKVPAGVLKSLETEIDLTSVKIDSKGAEDKEIRDIKRGVGYVFAFIIYFFIFFFGSQVMRGVVEEKSNRIVEIMASTVNPFYLMLGKIIGIGMVGLTQFLAWIILTVVIFQGISVKIQNDQLRDLQYQMSHTEIFSAEKASPASPVQVTDPKVEDVMKIIDHLNLPVLLLSFLFFFITGYLLYAAMFAAVGSAVDSETDTQQFMLPVTIPLIVSIFVMFNAIMNPEGQLATIFTVIPFTAPIIAMARIPFVGISADVLLSGILLIVSFIGMTWIAAKVYRTGILMYGKKISFKEIFKWIGYKN